MRSRERETAMNSDFRDKLSNAATAVEITLGMVILIACIVSGIGMVAMTDMDKLLNEVNGIIALCCDGEDPDTCEVSMGGCTGSCSTCGGCH